MPTAIWLDDFRDPSERQWREVIARECISPVEVIWVKTVAEFKVVFLEQTLDLQAVFFDNDLGTPEEGKDAFAWMEREVWERQLPPFKLVALTANTSARLGLLAGFENLRKAWRGQVDLDEAFGQLDGQDYQVGDRVEFDEPRATGTVRAILHYPAVRPIAELLVEWERRDIPDVVGVKHVRPVNPRDRVERIRGRKFKDWG